MLQQMRYARVAQCCFWWCRAGEVSAGHNFHHRGGETRSLAKHFTSFWSTFSSAASRTNQNTIATTAIVMTLENNQGWLKVIVDIISFTSPPVG